MDEAEVDATRETLRTSVQRMRGQADPEAIRVASTRAAEVLASLSGLQRARTVLVHHAVPGDLDPTPLVPRLEPRGVRILALGPDPTATPGSRGRPRASTLVPEVLAAGRAHLADAGEAYGDDLDLVEVVVLPGVAFDLDGGRLGPVDDPWPAILRRIDEGALRVGLARSAQLVPWVPRSPDDEDDMLVDVVVTDHSAHHTGARLGPRDA